MRKKTLVMVLLFLALSSLIMSHSMDIQARKYPPFVLVTSRYNNSTAISYAAVIVFNENQTVEYQNGRSDKNGKFVFMPDKTGKWSFHLDDEMGHAEKIEIMIEADFFKTQMAVEKEEGKKDLYFCKILIGLFLILVLTYFLFLWIKKRENKT